MVIVYRLTELGISAQAEADGELEELPDGDLIVNGRNGLNLIELEN